MSEAPTPGATHCPCPNAGKEPCPAPLHYMASLVGGMLPGQRSQECCESPCSDAGSPSLPQDAEDSLNGPGVAVIELSGADGSPPPQPTLRTLGLPQPSFHAVVLDFGPVNFVDTVSIKILKNVRGRGRRAGSLAEGVPRALQGGLVAAAHLSFPVRHVFCHLQIFRDFHEIEVDVFIAGCPGEEALQSHQPLLGMLTPSGHSCWPGAPPRCHHPQGFPRGQALQVVSGIQSEPRNPWQGSWILSDGPSPPAVQGEGGCSGWGALGSPGCHSFGCFSLHAVPVLTQLERGNFFSSTITKHCFFPTVHDAIVHISTEQRQASVRTQPRCPHRCDRAGAAEPTPPRLSPLGGPQHQNVAPREEDISRRSWAGEGAFATPMAPTHPPRGPKALYPASPSGL